MIITNTKRILNSVNLLVNKDFNKLNINNFKKFKDNNNAYFAKIIMNFSSKKIKN